MNSEPANERAEEGPQEERTVPEWLTPEQEAGLRAWARELAATAPPLSDRKLARLARLLTGYGHEHGPDDS